MAKTSALPVLAAELVDGNETIPVLKDGNLYRAPTGAVMTPYLNSAATSAYLARSATGLSEADISTLTIGDSTLDTTSTLNGTGTWSLGYGFPRRGVTGSVKVRMSAAAVLLPFVVDPDTRKVLKVFGTVPVVAGLNTVPAATFAGYVRPIGSWLFFLRASGAGIMRGGIGANGAPGIRCTTSITTIAVGDTLPAYDVVANAPAIEETLISVEAPLVDRLESLERLERYSGLTRPREIGKAIANFGYPAVNGYTTNTNIPMARLNEDRAWLQSLTVNVSAAMVGQIEFWQNQGDKTAWRYYSYPVTLAAGKTTLSFANLPLLPGTMVGVQTFNGGGQVGATGGIVYLIAKSAISDDKAPFTYTINGSYPDIQATLVEPVKDPLRVGKDTPLPIVETNFAGSAVPSKRWVLGSAFSVNDGLIASGAGSWGNIAYFDKQSNSHKRNAYCRLRITDPTTIHGLMVWPESPSTGGGTVVMIDCPAGKLRHYAWSGSGAGVLIGEVALPASTLAKIAASQPFDLCPVLVKTTPTVKVSPIEPLAQQKATHTYSVGASDDVSVRSLMRGSIGLVHIQGTVKVNWLRYYHGFPLNLDVAIFGDSNTEGTAVATTGTSWANLLAADNDRIMVSAIAGTTSSALMTRLNDLIDFRPARVIVNYGTNDSTDNATGLIRWRMILYQLCEYAEMIGAEPVLVIPNAGDGGHAARLATFDAGYFSRWLVVDFAAALSTANGRTDIAAAYIGSGVHYNAAGHVRAKGQVLTEAPQVAGYKYATLAP